MRKILDNTMKRKTKKKSVPEFKWVTDDGERLFPKNMETHHLFNSIKMMFNNVMPPALRVGSYKFRVGVREWSPVYLERAIAELVKELRKRKDFEDQDLLDDMFFNAELWNRLAQHRIVMVELPSRLTDWKHCYDWLERSYPLPDGATNRGHLRGSHKPSALDPSEIMKLRRRKILNEYHSRRY